MTIKVVNNTGEEVEINRGQLFTNDVKEKIGGTNSTAVKRYLQSMGLPIKNVLDALGYGDINRANVGSLLVNDGTRPLFNAVIEDGIRIGFEKESNWQTLVAREVSINQMSYGWYYLDSDDDEVELRDIGQGAEIPVGIITLGDNSIKMSKRGRGIEWTDESKSMNIDLVSLWLQQVGKKLGRDYERIAVTRLLNGYFTDGSDAAPILGVETANTLTLGDLFYAYQYMDQTLGFESKQMVMSLATAMKVVELKDGAGSYLFAQDMARGTFPNLFNNLFIDETVPANRIIFVDTSFALVRYTFKEFGVEFERSVKTQTEGSYGTEISEFVPFEKNARLIMKLDVAR